MQAREMNMDIAAIHQEATKAAEEAAAAKLRQIGGDRMACGFAWVNIYGVSLATKQGKDQGLTWIRSFVFLCVTVMQVVKLKLFCKITLLTICHRLH